MVYTKHFTIHTMKHLHQVNQYIKQEEKTKITKENSHSSPLDDLFLYIANDNKTMDKQLISGHGIVNVLDASTEFLQTKERFSKTNERAFIFNEQDEEVHFDTGFIEQSTGKRPSILGHHMIQSFAPDDGLTPEQIHEIGRQTMMEFTKGEYEFVIATHVDKKHIHNHIIVNSTNLFTGKAMPWKIAKLKNGENKDYTKELFEQISDKEASRYGAKIIEKGPKNSHKKYTMWQAEAIYKTKIKARLDFCLAHSSSMEDFIEKAHALDVKIDFSNKWATYRLLDEPQVKNTRGRSLNKKEVTHYEYDSIREIVKNNPHPLTVQQVVSQYEKVNETKQQSFDYELHLEAWQISHQTEKGYYINVDFGFDNRGQIFIGGYKIDALEDGTYHLFVKRNDHFYFIDSMANKRSRYMSGETLVKQLHLYNGNIPLKKHPVLEKMDDLVEAINFLAQNRVTNGEQLTRLNKKLFSSFQEAKDVLAELDEKLIELSKGEKQLLSNPKRNNLPPINEIKKERTAISLERNILQQKLETIKNDLQQAQELQVFSTKERE